MLPVSWSVCLDVGGRHAGAVTGAMNMAGQFGSFISSIAFGSLVDAYGGRYDVPLMVFSGMLAVSAVIFTTIDPTKPLVETAAGASEPVVPA
jgi:nitrate/nitrite transporter NarK